MPAPVLVVHDEQDVRELAVSALRAAFLEAALRAAWPSWDSRRPGPDKHPAHAQRGATPLGATPWRGCGIRRHSSSRAFHLHRLPSVRSPAMDDGELRRRAAHYKRVASLVSDEAITEALLELAATYEAMADNLRSARPERQE